MYYGRSRGAAIKFEGPRRTPKWWYATFIPIFWIVPFWSLSGRKITVIRLKYRFKKKKKKSGGGDAAAVSSVRQRSDSLRLTR